MAADRIHPGINHTEAAKQAATRARTLLSPILRAIQEGALSSTRPNARLQMLHAAESIAEASGILFEIERGHLTTFDALTMSVRARDFLRLALEALQEPDVLVQCPQSCAEGVAQALALVFAAAHGGDWKGRDELRRARQRVITQREVAERKVVFIDPRPDPPPSSRMHEPPRPAALQPALRPAASDAPPPSQRMPGSKRWNRRITGRKVIEVDVGVASASNFYAGITLDVSTGGLFVATYQIEPVGTPVAVSLVLPDGHSVWAKGVVCWVRDRRVDATEEFVPGMGVRFTSLEAEDRAAIDRFCSVRPPMYHDTDDK